MSAHVAPAHALGMAQDCLAQRLAALATDRPCRSRLSRTVTQGVAAAVGTTLPVLVSAALLVAVAAMLCLSPG